MRTAKCLFSPCLPWQLRNDQLTRKCLVLFAEHDATHLKKNTTASSGSHCKVMCQVRLALTKLKPTNDERPSPSSTGGMLGTAPTTNGNQSESRMPRDDGMDVDNAREKEAETNDCQLETNGEVNSGKHNSSSSNNNRQEKKTALYHCVNCGVDFSTNAILQRHRLLRHKLAARSERQCRASLRKENWTPQEAAQQQCGVCDKTFPSAELLDLHSCESFEPQTVESVTLSPPYSALQSDGPSTSDADISFACGMCIERFSTQEALLDHMEYEHSSDVAQHINFDRFGCMETESGLKCDVCGEMFVSPEDLRSHLVAHRKVVVPARKWGSSNAGVKVQQSARVQEKRALQAHPIECTNCDQIFDTGAALTQHKALCLSQCKICHEEFKGKVSLKKHMVHAHGPPGLCACAVCGQQFTSASGLRRHATTHNESEAQRFPFRLAASARRVGEAWATADPEAPLTRTSSAGGSPRAPCGRQPGWWPSAG